jgi:hypothetical protein
MALYTAWLAYDESRGVERLARAPALPSADSGERRNGETYRVSGGPHEIRADWLSPPDWPEAAGAVAYRVRTETLVDGAWRAQGDPETATIESVTIAGTPVNVGKWARVVIPQIVATRETGAGSRKTLAARVGADKPLVAWGTYQHGRLVDAPTRRLVLAVGGTEAATLEQLARESTFKTTVLTAMAALAGASGLLAAWRLRGKRPSA